MAKGMRRRRLSHVTNAHNPRVDLERTDVLQEETMEARRNEIERVWILIGCLKISYELKFFVVKRQRSFREKS